MGSSQHVLLSTESMPCDLHDDVSAVLEYVGLGKDCLLDCLLVSFHERSSTWIWVCAFIQQAW